MGKTIFRKGKQRADVNNSRSLCFDMTDHATMKQDYVRKTELNDTPLLASRGCCIGEESNQVEAGNGRNQSFALARGKN